MLSNQSDFYSVWGEGMLCSQKKARTCGGPRWAYKKIDLARIGPRSHEAPSSGEMCVHCFQWKQIQRGVKRCVKRGVLRSVGGSVGGGVLRSVGGSVLRCVWRQRFTPRFTEAVSVNEMDVVLICFHLITVPLRF